MRDHATHSAFIGLALFLLWVHMAPATAPAAPAAKRPTSPREREIQRLEKELALLETRLKEAMAFRARYKNLKADLAFHESLGEKDNALLKKVMEYLKTPVSLFMAFLSMERNSWEKAEKAMWRYTPKQTVLWLRLRFGLSAIGEKAYYTVRVDVVDAQVRIFQSLGPFQRRVGKLIEQVSFPLTGITVAPGTYQMRVSVEVSGSSVNRLIPFQMGQGDAPAKHPEKPPPPQGDTNTMGDF